jgi:hypothetical protein
MSLFSFPFRRRLLATSGMGNGQARLRRTKPHVARGMSIEFLESRSMLASVAMVSTTTADGAYGVNSQIAIQVEFDDSVNVTGSPRLFLNSGGFATFTGTSFSGHILNFTYMVRPGQNAVDLDVRDANALVLGRITNVLGGGLATRTLPVGPMDEALSAFSDIRIDTSAPDVPTVDSLRINPTIYQTNPSYFLMHPDYFTITGTAGSGPLEPGSVLTVTVNGAAYTPMVNGAGSWSVDLLNDSYSGGVINPWTSTSIANYEVVASLRDAAGNVSTDLTRNEITIDVTAPSVADVSSPTPNGAYNAGDTIDVDVTFTEPVAVVGVPRLQLNATPGNSFATFQSVTGPGGNIVRFRYTVQPGDTATDLDYVFPTGLTTAIVLDGGLIQDLAGNPAALTMPGPGAAIPGTLAYNKAIVIDTVAPTVTVVRARSSSGTYGPGAELFIEVTLSEAVIVSGPNPTLQLNSSPTAVATYVPPLVSPTDPQTVLRFRYVVAQGDRTADLDYRSSGALQLGGGGSSIQDVAGNDAVMLLPAPGTADSLAGQSNIVIASAPAVTSVTSNTADGSYTVGDRIDVRVQFDRDVTVTPAPSSSVVPSLRLNAGTNAFALYQSGSGTNTLVFEYVVAAGDQTAGDLDYSSTAALTTAGYRIVETAAFLANPSVTVDAILALPATGSSSVGSLDFNKNIRIVLDTSVPIAPSLALGVGIADGATYAEAGQPSGIVLVSGENFATIAVTFSGATSVTKNVTVPSTANGALQAVTLTPAEIVALGVGPISVVAKQTDRSGNASIDSALVTYSRITLPPVLSLGAGVSSGGASFGEATQSGGVVTVTAASGNAVAVTFSRVGGGTIIKNLTATGASQPVVLTSDEVASLGDGTVNVSATATDPAGLASTAATTSFTLDTVAPTLAITRSGSGVLTIGATDTITFTLSEAATNFTAADVTATGGTISGFSGSGTSYTATFTPNAGFEGNAIVSVAAGEFTDAAGNPNVAASTLSIPVDTVAPTLAITRVGSGVLTIGATDTITFTLSEAATNFTAADVTATGGAISGFSGSGTVYTATFTPNAIFEGNAIVSVAAGVFTDAAGNPNLTASTLSIPVDTVAPTLAITRVGSGVLTIGATDAITFTLSEAATNFTAADVTATGGTISGFGGSGTSYTATFTPDADFEGNASVSVAAGVFTDAAGNPNLPATALSIPVDTLAPTITNVSSSTANGTYGTGAVIDVSVQLSQPVVIAPGTAAALALNVGRNALLDVGTSTSTVLRFLYTVQVGDTAADLDYANPAALTVTAGSIRDAAGNDLVTSLPALPGSPRFGLPIGNGSLGNNKDLRIEGSIVATSPNFSSTSPGASLPYAVTTVPIVFSTPVTGFTTNNLILYLNNRPISIRGALVRQVSGTDWIVTLPRLSTNLRGNYRLDIVGAGILGTGGERMTVTSSLYWTRV